MSNDNKIVTIDGKEICLCCKHALERMNRGEMFFVPVKHNTDQPCDDCAGTFDQAFLASLKLVVEG